MRIEEKKRSMNMHVRMFVMADDVNWGRRAPALEGLDICTKKGDGRL